MANAGGNGGVPKFTQTAKSVSSLAGGGGPPKKYSLPAPISGNPPPIKTPKPRPQKTVNKVVSVNGPGGMSGYTGGARTVPVKAHTRQIKAKPVAAPVATNVGTVASAPPAAKPLPPTTDKPTSNGVGTGQNAGYFSNRSQVQLQPGQTLGFTTGRGYYARTAPPPAQQAQQQANPYAGVSLYGNQTPEQLAQAALQPQYSALDQQTGAEQQALTSFTTAVLNALQGGPSLVNENYNAAAQQMQSAAGGTRDSVLSQLYGAIPTRSYGEQAAAQSLLAGRQPGIQGLAAEQAMRNLLFQASSQRGQIAAQYPTLVNQYATAKSDSAAKQAALAQNAQALGVKTQQTNFQNQVTLKKLSQTDTRLQQTQDRIDYQTAAKQAGIKIQASKIDPSVSKVLGYVSTANGTPVTKGGKIIPVAASGKTSAAHTPSGVQVSKLVDLWRDGKVESVRVQATGKDGQPSFNPSTGAPIYISQSVQVGKVGYGQAYRRLTAMGIPEKQARAYLNTAYQRGTQGRAWVSNTEQAALLKAGLPPKARVIKGQGVLSPKQAAVLRRAGLLPAGQLTREGFYVIAPGF